MISVRTKITRNRHRELTKQGKEGAARRNAELAEATAVIARQLVHVVTGETRDSIAAELNRRTGSASVVVGGAGLFEELGTVHRAPHPFLRPAADLAVKKSRGRKARIYKG